MERIENLESDHEKLDERVRDNTTTLAVVASRVATFGGIGALLGAALGAGAVAAIAKLGGG